MKSIRRFELIVNKLKELYGDLENLKTNNDSLCTKVFINLEQVETLNHFEISEDRIPILECSLPNKNYLLATTSSLHSIFNNNIYEMDYDDFDTNDRSYFSKNSQIAEGKTRTFRYELKNGKDFIYEIDSLYPADIVHNRLVMSMRHGKYD